MTDRAMPSADAEERAVIACLLVDSAAAYDRIVPLVSPPDFRVDGFRAILEAVAAMEGRGVDPITVHTTLREQGRLDANGVLSGIGGLAAIAGLTDPSPDIANVEKYADAVRDAAVRRRVIHECQRFQAAAFSSEPVADIATAGVNLFSDLANARKRGPVTIRAIAKRAMERLDARMVSQEWITGVSTGLQSIDNYTLGIQRGVLTVAGARPRVGKTALMIAIAIAVLRKDEQRVFISELDMSEAMFGDRILAAMSGVSSFKLRTGQGLYDAELARINEAAKELRSWSGRLLVDHSTRDMAMIAAHVRREARAGMDMVMIDHIGHVRGGKGEKRYLEIGDVSARTIDLAGETGSAAIALVQLNRDAESREPELSDLRESGNLEQDARLILLLDRPSLRAEEHAKCLLHVKVPKNEGETGERLTLHFDLRRQQIREQPEGDCYSCGGERAATDRRLPIEH